MNFSKSCQIELILIPFARIPIIQEPMAQQYAGEIVVMS